jgi:hypothetical protein
MSEIDYSRARDYEQDLWEFEKRQKSSQRFQQVFQIYAVLGGLVGALSLAYYFFRQMRIELSWTDGMILLTSGSGFVISIVSVLYLFLRKQKYTVDFDHVRYVITASEFLAEWARFERLGLQKLDAMGQQFNKTSIKEITSRLFDLGILKSNDALLVDEALRLRNSMVHGGARADVDVLRQMTKAVSELADRMEVGTIA